MKELIPMGNNLVFIKKDDVFTSSKIIAENTNIEHESVQRILRKYKSDFEEFGRLRFSDSKSGNLLGGRPEKIGLLNEQQALLLMTYLRNNDIVRMFKKELVRQFYSMREQLTHLISTKQDYPKLTAHIAALHENPQTYHFSNECDMLNRLVTGMSAKKFRELHNIPNNEAIRPYLNKDQIKLMDTLQGVDIGLLLTEPEYQKRKIFLEWYVQNMYTPKIAKMLK